MYYHGRYAARFDYILFSVLQSMTLLVMAAKTGPVPGVLIITARAVKYAII